MSRFFLSLEDSLMRIFASDRVRNMMKSLGMQEGEAIEHRWVTRSIENAQKKVEGRNFDIRKSLLEFDDVNNDQRKAIYGQRNYMLVADSVEEAITNIRKDVVTTMVNNYIPPQSVVEQWDIPGLEQTLKQDFALSLPVGEWLDEDKRLNDEGLKARVLEHFAASYQEKIDNLGDASIMRQFEKQIMLQVLDRLWKEHLASMDHLRQGIHLRGYASKNPKQEYKREAYTLFEALLDNIKFEVIRMISNVEIRKPEEVEALEQQRREQLERQRMEFKHDAAEGASPPDMDEGSAGAQAPSGEQGKAEPFQREGKKVGRNDACPCGSGKKFKHCHGKVA